MLAPTFELKKLDRDIDKLYWLTRASQNLGVRTVTSSAVKAKVLRFSFINLPVVLCHLIGDYLSPVDRYILTKSCPQWPLSVKSSQYKLPEYKDLSKTFELRDLTCELANHGLIDELHKLCFECGAHKQKRSYRGKRHASDTISPSLMLTCAATYGHLSVAKLSLQRNARNISDAKRLATLHKHPKIIAFIDHWNGDGKVERRERREWFKYEVLSTHLYAGW